MNVLPRERKMSRSVASALTFGLLLACGAARPVAAPTTGDATPLLRAMADRYAALRAYEDKGSVVMTTHHAQGAAEAGPHVDFETAFDRASGGYRFALTRSYPDAKHPPEHGTVWRTTHGPAHTSFSFAPGAQQTNLCTAMLDFAGSSVGASFHVPAMLAGRSVIGDDSSMLRGAEFHFDGEQDVDGIPCTKVSSKDPAMRVSLWISKSDLSLRRIFQSVRGDGTLEVTTSYSPKFEGTIDARRFTNDVQ